MKQHPVVLLAVAALATGSVSCTATDQAAMAEEDVAAVNAAREMEAEGVGSGDANAALAAYTDDVVFMAPNEPAMIGKDALRAWFEAGSEQMDISVSYASSDIMIAGDWAIERYVGTATFAPKDGSDAVEEQLKGIHIYRRQADGTWKIAQDIWNTDAPPPEM